MKIQNRTSIKSLKIRKNISCGAVTLYIYIPVVALCTAFRVRTAANCNVLMADRISLPVAEHSEEREEAAVGGGE
jgi:hypothetical protein